MNLTILPTINPIPYDEYRAVNVESGVEVVETAGSSPERHLPDFEAAGVKVIHKATSVRHALSGLILIPAAVRRLHIPVIASGGMATRAGLVAALALGADAVNMGTRFTATTEAPIHENLKHQIGTNDERDTVLVFRKFHNSTATTRQPYAASSKP